MITFTDKNGRAVRIKTATPNPHAVVDKGDDIDLKMQSADEIVMGLLSKVPESEFLVRPATVAER